MNILCVIPARGKSKRIKNKNIRLLLGKPVISYTIEKALKSNLCSRVVVSTDDYTIARVAERFGAKVIMRPASIARDISPIDDALRHAVRYLRQKEDFSADVIVLLQANVPVRKEGEIDEVIAKLINLKDATAVATAYEIDQRPEWAKIIHPKSGKFVSFMKPTHAYRKQDLPRLYLLDGAIIAVHVKPLMDAEGEKRIHAYMGSAIYPFLHEKKYAIEIDEELDFPLAEYYLNPHGGNRERKKF